MSVLKYTEDHEAVALDGDVVAVGITSHAREALGDLVFIELPEIGRSVAKGDDCAVVESVKTAAEIYAPVTGDIVAVNEAMSDNLDLIKKPVTEDGWIVKIKTEDASVLAALMDQAQYEEFVENPD